MKLIRYAYPQSQASNAINRLFDIGAPAIGRIGSMMDDFLAAEAEFNQPALDLYEDEQHYYARFELPGLAKDKIDLELENAVLTLQSQQDCQQESKCFETRFKRSISVPDGVDLDQVSAAMSDGILTITMPKSAVPKPRQISVK